MDVCSTKDFYRRIRWWEGSPYWKLRTGCVVAGVQVGDGEGLAGLHPPLMEDRVVVVGFSSGPRLLDLLGEGSVKPFGVCWCPIHSLSINIEKTGHQSTSPSPQPVHPAVAWTDLALGHIMSDAPCIG